MTRLGNSWDKAGPAKRAAPAARPSARRRVMGMAVSSKTALNAAVLLA
jgi:hypothetical protein